MQHLHTCVLGDSLHGCNPPHTSPRFLFCAMQHPSLQISAHWPWPSLAHSVQYKYSTASVVRCWWILLNILFARILLLGNRSWERWFASRNTVCHTIHEIHVYHFCICVIICHCHQNNKMLPSHRSTHGMQNTDWWLPPHGTKHTLPHDFLCTVQDSH
jgi:hypothetical protein